MSTGLIVFLTFFEAYNVWQFVWPLRKYRAAVPSPSWEWAVRRNFFMHVSGFLCGLAVLVIACIDPEHWLVPFFAAYFVACSWDIDGYRRGYRDGESDANASHTKELTAQARCKTMSDVDREIAEAKAMLDEIDDRSTDPFGPDIQIECDTCEPVKS